MAWPTRGERFNIDLDSENESHDTKATPLFNFINDIKERSSAAPKAPSAPSVKNQSSGFPAHKKRVSKFAAKQQRASTFENVLPMESDSPSIDTVTAKPEQPHSEALSFEEKERLDIDAENTQRLAQMSDTEIEEARAELLSSLNPTLVERLLRRANIDDGHRDGDFPSLDGQTPDLIKREPSRSTKKVSFQHDAHHISSDKPDTLTSHVEAKTPESDHAILESTQANQTVTESVPSDEHDEEQEVHELPSIHFPPAPKPPDLDPSSPSFLSDLHSKYFPDLSHDPTKLSWMTEPSAMLDSTSSSDNNYSPDASSFAPAEIRFSFTGALIPPRIAHRIPVNKGLHHHGQAPDAAGYTIEELAILSRSAYPSQRCIGYAVLGRLLWRLGKGEFGDTMAAELVRESESGEQVDDARNEEERIARGKGELARGLWQVIHDQHVIELLTTAASDEGEKRHQSAKAYAQEAVWLWRRGGGRRWKAE